MKKPLAIICTAMLLTSFVSCGDTQESSSEPSDSVSEEPTEIEYIKYETDYFSFEVPATWKIEDVDSPINIDTENGHIIFTYYHSDMYDKLTTEEMKERWVKNAKDMEESIDIDEGYALAYSELYENREIEKTFVKNTQAYILVKDSTGEKNSYIEFRAENLEGRLAIYAEAEEDAMLLLDTMQFN
ncbi:MAG: hypothetical protein NC548_62970 [Lachnospiraceae bacterium]|nr:hypothetical protein [Lachnospiraceae bacterium]MCM1237276.1 hypothetical protein [Ruminococcus flavefaciens]